jgi:hypothetical protein
MPTISALRIPAHVRSVIDDDGAVLLDVNRGTYFSLNAVGVEIWKCLEAGMTLDQIGHALASEFEAPSDVVAGDLQAFAHLLSEKSLVDVIE